MKKRKLELLRSLNELKSKYKFNKRCDLKVRQAFAITNSISFEDLIHNDPVITQCLITEFK